MSAMDRAVESDAPGDAAREVFLLGAGFSRAVHSPMPTLAELGRDLATFVASSPRYTSLLGEAVVARLKQGKIPGGNLEVWLSSLAESQPYLDESTVAHNYGLFLSLTDQVVNDIVKAQEGFFLRAEPWFSRLIRLWHRRRPTVITFNYDTIIEDSLPLLEIPVAYLGALPELVTDYLPVLAMLPSSSGSEIWKTFRLCKLHGSVDWYWLPSDATGETVRRWPPGRPLGEADRAVLAGKGRLVIPPLSAKSRFYSLGIVREFWKRAAEALTLADRVTVIGYSMPMTDLATTAMVASTVRPGTAWCVVDTRPDAVSAEIERLGVSTDPIIVMTSVAEFVDRYEQDYCRDMSTRLLAELRDYLSSRPATYENAPIVVEVQRLVAATVGSIERSSEAIVLRTTPIEWNGSAPDPQIPGSYASAGELLKVLAAHEATPVPVIISAAGDAASRVVLGVGDELLCRGRGGAAEWVPLDVQNRPSAWAGRLLPHQPGAAPSSQ
jgi:hypothetical protein